MTANDLAALDASAERGHALCTLVGIEGSFSRRLGAQIAVGPDETTIGSLSDGCLERQLVAEVRTARAAGTPTLVRFGAGSPYIDFRLPCGGGLDILVDPAPDRDATRRARSVIARREIACLSLPLPPGLKVDLLRERIYLPPLRILPFGEGPELAAFAKLASALRTEMDIFDLRGEYGASIHIGYGQEHTAADAWTAIVLLFHDHDWEQEILSWAMRTRAFYIGAQGGARTRHSRTTELLRRGNAATEIERIHSPIGLIPRAREPEVLALSVFAEIVASYGQLHAHS